MGANDLPRRIPRATLTPDRIDAVPTDVQMERARLLAVAEECELGDNAEMARICRSAAYDIPTAATVRPLTTDDKVLYSGPTSELDGKTGVVIGRWTGDESVIDVDFDGDLWSIPADRLTLIEQVGPRPSSSQAGLTAIRFSHPAPALAAPSIVVVDAQEALNKAAFAWVDMDPDHDPTGITTANLIAAIVRFRAVTR